MDVLTSETCWAVNNEIIKQVTSSWSPFIQIWINVTYRNTNSLRKQFNIGWHKNRAEQNVTDDSGIVEYVDIAFVQSVSSCTDGADCYKYLDYTCFGISPILLLIREIIYGCHVTAAIMALGWGGLVSSQPMEVTLLFFTETEHISVWMASTRIT